MAYAVAIAGIVVSIPLSAFGWWDLLPDASSDTTKGIVCTGWFLFSTWAVAFTFWESGDRRATRAVDAYRERHEGAE